MIARALAWTAVIFLGGCIGGGPLKNVNCEWPPDHPVSSLDLVIARDVRHLADDAQTAEDLAIRHADASPARASHSRDATEYQAVREQCKSALFAVISRQHNVPVDAVSAAVADRREWLDALVILGFGILFAMVAKQVAVRMLRGALGDSRVLATAMLLVASLAAGGTGLLAGGIWCDLIESVRVGNGHMSSRVERMPVHRNRLAMFVACTSLFAAVSAVQYRKTRL
jgi:hypothetical protein